MEGFDVYSVNDDKSIGTVVERSGDYLIIEHGTLRKTRNALPMTFAEVDDAGERVVTTLAGRLVHESPKVDGAVDTDAVATHYGLAGATTAEGLGHFEENELATSAESDMRRGGGESVTEQRVRVREELGSPVSHPAAESPSALGDRYGHLPKTRDE